MPGLVVTIDVDCNKQIDVKDHEGNLAKTVKVKDPNNPIQTLSGQTIVAMQTATIIWTKSSPGQVCLVIGGNLRCFG